MIQRLFAALFILTLMSAPARADDIAAVRDADAGRFDQAQSEARSKSARDVVTWMYLTSDKTRASFPEIAAFVGTHPDWPSSDRLFKAAEGRLPQDLSDAQVINWFQRNKPVSSAGIKRYMAALLAQRQTQAAVTTLKDWWVDANISASEQSDVLNNYGQYLGTADHTRRLQRIMTDKQYTPARALAAYMGGGYPQLVEARVALQEGQKGVEQRMSAVPRNLQQDTGLLLSRVQFRRQNNMDADAIALLNQAPPAGRTPDPSAWWKERNVLTRRMIEAHNYKLAYQLASQHGLPSEGADFANAEFTAGWLALRFLRQPYPAFEHFEKLFNNTQTPISRARAAYWAGRASEAMGSNDVALQWFQVAARYQTTFYGQQAAAHINLPLNLIKGDKPAVSRAQQDQFDNRDMVQAAQLLHRAGLADDRAAFLRALMKAAQTPQDYSMLSDFAVSMGQVNMAVKIAKEAEKSGLYLIDYAFPTITQTVGNAGGTDKALVHALIRQESQFDPNAISSAGALGLMQIMPATGKHTAKNAGLMHNTAWLTAKPEHNVQIGALYIQELLNTYGGTMPMAIAAYNAGPGRVNQWIRENGDPRSGQIDMIDWIESIPIYETRNYVQRVMEGYAVYRAKLSRFNGQPALQVQRLNSAYNKR